MLAPLPALVALRGSRLAAARAQFGASSSGFSVADPSLVDLRPSVHTNQGHCSSDGKWASSMVALARNLNFFGSRFLTGLTAVFVARLHQAPAWQVRTLVLFIGRHHCLPLSFLDSKVPPTYEIDCSANPGLLRNRSFEPTRIVVGSRRVRISGSFPLIA